MEFVATANDAPGSYQVFVALVRPGAAAGGRVAASDILAFDPDEFLVSR